MPETPKVVQVEPHNDHTMTLTFAGGEQRRFDLTPLLNTEVFAPLRDLNLFRSVRIVYGSLEWPGERDLAYDMLYVESTPVTEGVE